LVVNAHFCMDGESFGQLNVAHSLPGVGLHALLYLSGLDIIKNREIYELYIQLITFSNFFSFLKIPPRTWQMPWLSNRPSQTPHENKA